MERKYPAKLFWFFVITNFLFRFFYLSISGIILCIVGIWVKPCLWIGLAVFGLDVILSIIEQLRIRKAVITPSDNPEFNELMDAFCGSDGFDAVRRIADEKINTDHTVEEEIDDGGD